MRSLRSSVKKLAFLLAVLVLLLAGACSGNLSSPFVRQTPEKPAASSLPLNCLTPYPGADPAEQSERCRSGGWLSLPSATAVFTLTPPLPTETALPSTPVPPTDTPQLAVCTANVCFYPNPFVLNRPIAPPGIDFVDPTYRFGSDRGGTFKPHHGVEFLNEAGTPVLAAAAGEVVVAGDDRSVLYSPSANFYGNLVVIRHDLKKLLANSPGLLRLPLFSAPQGAAYLYTLYGHLSKVLVKAGESVKVGQTIGLVGMSGAATGSHLHFEVRFGENTYDNARNPELWLIPHLDADGQPKGALAGRILDNSGRSLFAPDIVVGHVPTLEQPEPTTPNDWEVYVGTYKEKSLIGQLPWEESFAVGDLPAGWYQVSFAYLGLRRYPVQVLPGHLTVVTLRVDIKQ